MFSYRLRDDAVLMPLEVQHAAEFAAHMDRAREHIRPWVGPGFLSADTESARALLLRYAERNAADGGRLFGIWLGSTLVGGVMFVSFDAASGTCELGCWLEPSAEGRGLVTAASRVLLDYAFAERGLYRAEWKCRSGNDRSSAVARRLGMTLEGTLRGVWPFDGERYDKEVWAVLASDIESEWQAENAEDKAAIDTLTAEFFAAFDNRDGGGADVGRIRRLMIPEGVIVVAGPSYKTYTVEEFVVPREELLAAGGRLTEFSEWETEERTEVSGNVASRFGRYEKYGLFDGEVYEGSGTKTIQFVRMPEGWRISAFAWHDQS